MSTKTPKFDQAEKKYAEFLASNGLPERIAWIFREDAATRCRGIPWIRLPIREENRALAKALYEHGRTANRGIKLDLFCVLADFCSCAYVWIPSDERSAELELVRDLSMSVPQAPRVARGWTDSRAGRLLYALGGRKRPDPWLDKVPLRAEARVLCEG